MKSLYRIDGAQAPFDVCFISVSPLSLVTVPCTPSTLHT
ncbi:hypothetical protein BX592_101173 [Paraburkholderia rhizosphaerae]|uniref:Uncharacterized protein n=1 Tax=Paraburkholderia rhizosphaerae TaxID=480658 RepID=A0A4V6QD72_9BURK|nr:hypothetical protein BX592_101173 [Paraburkholderia rhizosphaerae]